MNPERKKNKLSEKQNIAVTVSDVTLGDNVKTTTSCEKWDEWVDKGGNILEKAGRFALKMQWECCGGEEPFLIMLPKDWATKEY